MGDFLHVIGGWRNESPLDLVRTDAPRSIHQSCKAVVIIAASLVLGLLLGLTSSSTAAVADDFYAAIAFSHSSGAHGWANDYNSRRGAEREALSGCGHSDCTVVQWIRNACAALAVGEGNGYGTGWAGGRGRAEGIAMSNCNGNTRNCGVVRWVCTTR